MMLIGDVEYFPYRSSSYITRFFEECDLDFVHDGTTHWLWIERIVPFTKFITQHIENGVV